jgi:hypothetical protein
MIVADGNNMSATLMQEAWAEPEAASVPLHFGPSPADRRRAERPALESLRVRLVTVAVERAEDPHAAAALRWAGADAAAIAALCDLPLLVFPELFEEKAREAVSRTQRQRAIWGRTRRALARALPERLRELWGDVPRRAGKNGGNGGPLPKTGLIFAGRNSGIAVGTP